MIDGDRQALVRALDHLADNAARTADTLASVSIVVSDGEIAIRVDDDRPGIAEAGLAVASDVAAAHGGQLVITDAPIGGARVTIILPTPTAGP